MTDGQARKYLDTIINQLGDGKLSPKEALERAFALGCETERMDAMHHACEQYSRARAAREAAFSGG